MAFRPWPSLFTHSGVDGCRDFPSRALQPRNINERPLLPPPDGPSPPLVTPTKAPFPQAQPASILLRCRIPGILFLAFRCVRFVGGLGEMELAHLFGSGRWIHRRDLDPSCSGSGGPFEVIGFARLRRERSGVYTLFEAGQSGLPACAEMMDARVGPMTRIPCRNRNVGIDAPATPDQASTGLYE